MFSQKKSQEEKRTALKEEEIIWKTKHPFLSLFLPFLLCLQICHVVWSPDYSE